MYKLSHFPENYTVYHHNMYFYGFDQFDQNIAQKQASNVCKGKREMGVAN
jgi:hypothetical protein